MSIRSSASLLVVAPSNKLLFMRRPQHGTYPNSHVFPGGVVEEGDNNLTYTALRETYEETGLFIAPTAVDPIVHPIGRHKTYDEALSTAGVKKTSIDWHDPWKLGMLPISKWITPAISKKRYATQFYVYQVAKAYDLEGIKSSEAELLEWLTPGETLQKFNTGAISLNPPQFYLVREINEYGLQRAIERLCNRTFEPKLIGKSEDGLTTKLDWGQGEAGEITREASSGIIRNIKYIKL